MKLAPLLKAVLLAVLGLSLAGSLLSHDGVGVVEWLVGVAAVAALAAGATYFARQSLRTT